MNIDSANQPSGENEAYIRILVHELDGRAKTMA